MSKRHLSKQQQARIAKKQKAYETEENEDLFNGLVITRFGKQAEIEDEQGNRIICTTRPHLDTLVAGDKVLWQPEGKDQGAILSLLPRSSVLNKAQEKPIAANISQLVIVVAPKPEIVWSLLDSYLVIAENMDANALIILNKIDLPSETIQKDLEDNYSALGYPLLFLHKNDTKGYEQLIKALNHHTNVFVGQSGVGKSSIIGQILPDIEVAVGEISEQSDLGKHTTSASRYYHLPQGGALIDSPGVREFSLEKLDRNSLLLGYREFRPFLSLCKFRNCNHLDTPGCALLNALENGKIKALRYNNFKKLVEKFWS